MKSFGKLLVSVGLMMFCLIGIASVTFAEELTIVGTGSGTVILEAISAAFQQQYPDVTIQIPESIGSSGGILFVGRDEFILGRVSRRIKEAEEPYGLTYVPYANMPIVFFTSKDVTVKNLSAQQILDIYSGVLTDWNDVGGENAKIRVVTREEGDSSLGVLLDSFPGFKNITITSKAKTTFSDPETEETALNVADVIAYGSYPNAKVIDVNILTIDEKSPADEDYPYVGVLGFVYKEQNYTGTLKAFVEFATSEAAYAVIREAGGIPVK